MILCNKMNTSPVSITEETYSQASQDLFVLKTLHYKRNGTFLEIGSSHPIDRSNTFLLENKYDWNGIILDRDSSIESLYKIHRPKSLCILENSTQMNYEKVLETFPRDMDYLQMNLEIHGCSALQTLVKLNEGVLQHHRFAVVTFQHDAYRKMSYVNGTRDKSRTIFHSLGYILLYADVNAFEDWYVHPDLVSPAILKNRLLSSIDHTVIVNHLNYLFPIQQQSEKRLYFLVYDDGTHTEYLDCLIASVKEFGKQFEIIVFNKNEIDAEFRQKNENTLSCSRGGGYWLWKPYIINETLKKIKTDDILFYLDSKYYFVEPFENLYKEYMKNKDILIWKNKPNEAVYLMKNWCKMDVVIKYDMCKTVFYDDAVQCWAGAMILKKNARTMRYIKTWLDMCTYENISDSPSVLPNLPLYQEHRHDQSLLGIVILQNNIELSFFECKYLKSTRKPW